jgi:hypothetical protein
VTVLANLTRRAFALEEPPEYVMYQGPMSGESRHFWATVHVYGRGISPERPYRFTGRTTSFEPQAIQLAAREAIVQLRHLSPRVNCRHSTTTPAVMGMVGHPRLRTETTRWTLHCCIWCAM